MAEYFGKSLSSLTLADAIADEALRQKIQQIENLIQATQYKQALEAMAYIMFEQFERPYAIGHGGLFGVISAALRGEKLPPPEEQTNVFPEIGVDLVHRIFLELGIEPDLYYRFRTVVPAVGYNNLRNKKPILKKDYFAWHERNWTEENCRFCIEFLTNFFVRRQRGYRGYKIYSKIGNQTITFLRDSTFYGNVLGSGDAPAYGGIDVELPGQATAGNVWWPCHVHERRRDRGGCGGRRG